MAGDYNAAISNVSIGNVAYTPTGYVSMAGGQAAYDASQKVAQMTKSNTTTTPTSNYTSAANVISNINTTIAKSSGGSSSYNPPKATAVVVTPQLNLGTAYKAPSIAGQTTSTSFGTSSMASNVSKIIASNLPSSFTSSSMSAAKPSTSTFTSISAAKPSTTTTTKATPTPTALSKALSGISNFLKKI